MGSKEALYPSAFHMKAWPDESTNSILWQGCCQIPIYLGLYLGLFSCREYEKYTVCGILLWQSEETKTQVSAESSPLWDRGDINVTRTWQEGNSWFSYLQGTQCSQRFILGSSKAAVFCLLLYPRIKMLHLCGLIYMVSQLEKPASPFLFLSVLSPQCLWCQYFTSR